MLPATLPACLAITERKCPFETELTKRNAVFELECRRHWHSRQLLPFPSGTSPRPGLTVYLPDLFNDFVIPAYSAWDIFTVVPTLPGLQSQLDG